MSFDTTEQFQAAAVEAQRETTAAVERLREDVARLVEGLTARIAPIQTAIEQLELGALAAFAPAGPTVAHATKSSNGHGPTHSRRFDGHGQELPRGVSWDARGDVWCVDVSNPGQPRRRVRIPGDRFTGPALALAEACRVRRFLRGEDVRRQLAEMHPETARDCAEAMATT